MNNTTNKNQNILLLTGIYPQNDYSGIFIKNEVDALTKKDYNIEVIHKTGKLKHFKIFWGAYKALLTNKFGLIHAHYIFPYGTMGAILSIIFKKPLIITAHGSDVNVLLHSKFFKSIINWTLKRCKTLICVSTQLKTKITKLNLNINIAISPCSVDTNEFKHISQDDCCKILNKNPKCKYLIFIGNLTKNKRVNLIINSMPKILIKYPNAHLLIIGSGNQKDFLVNLVTDYKINSNVHFLGNISHNDIPIYQNLSDLILLVSKEEGTPVVATEACQCGKKIIITKPGELELWKKQLPNLIILSENNLKDLDSVIIKELNKELKFKVDNEFSYYFSLNGSTERLMSIYNNIFS